MSRRPLWALTAGVLVALATGCGSGDDRAATAPTDAPACPTDPVSVVVSVDQWGGIVSELGGQCATVTTVLAGSAVDPHDFEPSPRDAAVFEGAQLVVVNGGHYDEWATRLAAGSAPDAPVVEAFDGHAKENGSGEHDHSHDEHDEPGNPHAWYDPAAVRTFADTVTARLGELAPDAAGYFADRRARFTETLAPYEERIAALRAGAANKSYAATETVFEPMAAAVGLTDRTPEGYRTASANETDPSPADLDAFLTLLDDRGVDVLVHNTQTEGSVPQQIVSAAEQAGIPVVEVTETMPSDAASFTAWQVDQLTALSEALGVPS